MENISRNIIKLSLMEIFGDRGVTGRIIDNVYKKNEM